MNSSVPAGANPLHSTLHLMFGGTFDPVHNGHLRMAVEMREVLEAHSSGGVEVHLLPCHIPPHRESPGATADHRCSMLSGAIAGESGLVVDRRELDRAEPSYSVETLVRLRDELGSAVPLAMAVGTDSFVAIDRWHRWREIIELAHIIVIERPGYRIAPETEAARLLESRQADSAAGLWSAAAGKVLPLGLSLLDISATGIRDRIAAGRSPRYLLPDSVWQYICEHSLYMQ